MKFANSILPFVFFLFGITFSSGQASAQQYKLKQVTSMSGMRSETTIYVKGPRKRTEGGGFTGMPNPLVTIEQCDKQRLVTINDRKKLYFIEPFAKDEEEVSDEDKKAPKPKPAATQAKAEQRKGGVITMWYNITDTGERKKMYGITARRVWTTQKMVPSADACYMKDSMIIKTDGWYIDLPQFNCPVRYASSGNMGGASMQPDCKDRYVTKRSGKGKLGFPLVEKRTMIMGNGNVQTSQFETNLETLELSTEKLDSLLFEIPEGYALAKSLEELEEKVDPQAMIEAYKNNRTETQVKQIAPGQAKTAGKKRIGVLLPEGGEQLQPAELQAHLVNVLSAEGMEAVAISSAEEAKSFHCDLVLASQFTKVKQASKIGGLLKAIKNADPNAATSFTIDVKLTLTDTDGARKGEKKVSGKFEGTADGAAKKALEEGSREVVNGE